MRRSSRATNSVSQWAHLRDGGFVVKTELTEVQPVAHDRDRERRLWEATAELLERAGASRQGLGRGARATPSRWAQERPVSGLTEAQHAGVDGDALPDLAVDLDVRDEVAVGGDLEALGAAALVVQPDAGAAPADGVAVDRGLGVAVV